ncbi:MAG: AraC family transcriptional regulator [Spirochaetota bacterium]
MKEYPNYTKREYQNRINRVIDFIEKNLEEELSLGKLSGVANFSPHHFHRIFSANIGEPLNQFIQRLRLEKAAGKLLADSGTSITQIALDCGFSSSSAFARTFKDFYGTSASKWREEKFAKNSKIRKVKSKDCEDSLHNSVTITDNNTQTRNHTMPKQSEFKQPISVEVRELPSTSVVYLRHIGNFKEAPQLFQEMFSKLINWTGARNLLNFPETKVMTVYHDNPEITEEDKMRTSLCITVPQETQVEGEIGKMTLQGGKYAIAHFELQDPQEFAAAWNGLYGRWLPESGFQPNDGPPFEVYLNNPAEHPEKLSIVDIYLPVKVL